MLIMVVLVTLAAPMTRVVLVTVLVRGGAAAIMATMIAPSLCTGS